MNETEKSAVKDKNCEGQIWKLRALTVARFSFKTGYQSFFKDIVTF